MYFGARSPASGVDVDLLVREWSVVAVLMSDGPVSVESDSV